MPPRDRDSARVPVRPAAGALRGGLVLGAIVVFLAVLVHAGSIQGGANEGQRLPEDGLVCWSNPAVVGPGPGPALAGRFYSPERDGFRPVIRPLPLVLLRAEHSAFGESGAGYQVVQLLLLGLAGMFFFLLLEAWWGSIAVAAFGALALVAHPLTVEMIAGIAGVSELLALVFFLAAVWWVKTGRNVLAAGGLVLLAALSNEIAFAAIPALGIWAWTRRGADEAAPATRGTWRRLRSEPIAYFAFVAAAAGLVALLYRALILWTLPGPLKIARAVEAWTGVGSGKQVLVGLAAVFEGLRLVVFPLRIGYTDDYLLTSGLSPLRAAAGLVVCALLVWLLVRTMRRREPAAFWAGLTLLSLIGASGLFIRTGAILPPRALVFVIPGVIGLAAGGVQWVLRRDNARRRPAWLMIGVAVLGLIGWRTIGRTADYRDWETLVQRQTVEFPRSAQGWYDLGNIRLTRGDEAAARAAYDEALKLRPDFWEAWLNLGVSYAAEDDRGLAMRAFTEAVNGTAGNDALRSVWARARYHQGLVYLTQTKNVDAARCFEDMLAVFPDHLYSHANLGMLYTNSEYLDEQARSHLHRALHLETDPKRRETLQGFLDAVAKRRAQLDRDAERRSGGNIPGAVPVDSLP